MRRWIEQVLLFTGLTLLGMWGGVEIASRAWQAWQSHVFDQQVHDQQARSTSPTPRAPAPKNPTPKKGDVLGRLSIPRLDVSTMVREGDDDGVLSLAAGHIPGTALPGQNGNMAVAGHRDTIFRALKEIRKDDVIRFETVTGSHDYVVDTTNIVMPDDVDVLRSGKRPQLTLVTCYPFYYVGAAPKRFIVSAHEVSDPPLRPEARQVSEERAVPKNISSNQDDIVPRSTPARQSNQPGIESSVRPVVSRASFSPASSRQTTDDDPQSVRFEIVSGHSAEIGPGLSLGISDARNGRADGWIWIMPDRRSVVFKNQGIGRPLVFFQDGARRELTLTRASSDAVSGSIYLGSD